MAEQCFFAVENDDFNCNATGNSSVSELNNEHLDAADTDSKYFIIDEIVVENQVAKDEFGIEESVIQGSEKYDDINTQLIQAPLAVIKKEVPVPIIDHENVTKKNSEVQVLRRSPRIQAKQRQMMQNSQPGRSQNVPKTKFEAPKKRRRQKKTKNTDTDNTSMMLSGNIRTCSRKNIPESIVRISSENGQTIVSFKMRDQEKLKDIPQRNLTLYMRNMLVNYYKNQLQTLDVSASTIAETSAAAETSAKSSSPSFNIVPLHPLIACDGMKLIKRNILDYKNKQQACLKMMNFFKDNNLNEYEVDVKLAL